MTPATQHPDRPPPAKSDSSASSRGIIITIDGPAGTGKSSVARVLAKRLGLEFLDTGAMYRAAAALALDKGLSPANADAIVDEVAATDMHFDWTTDPPTLYCGGKSVMQRLRDVDVTAIVSPIAGIPGLRRQLVRMQQQIAAAHPRLVTEGRDQGSVVFPDADVKIFLHADPKVRARRRAEQLRAAGQSANEQVLAAEISERDQSDATRQDGPLTCPDDAHRVDTSELGFDQVVDTLEGLVLRQLAARTKKKDFASFAFRA
ncbi:MAG: (d)CMP kinase [Anaerolineae bacterium]|nr:(d)CMP kinase [Phycisphaerae bacterium]